MCRKHIHHNIWNYIKLRGASWMARLCVPVGSIILDSLDFLGVNSDRRWSMPTKSSWPPFTIRRGFCLGKLARRNSLDITRISFWTLRCPGRPLRTPMLAEKALLLVTSPVRADSVWHGDQQEDEENHCYPLRLTLKIKRFQEMPQIHAAHLPHFKNI